MKSLSLFFAFLFVVMACNNNSKNNHSAAADSVNNNKAADAVTMQKVEPVKLAVADIPASITIKGKAEEVWKWEDKTGENYLITSIVAPYKVKCDYPQMDEPCFTTELNAYHYRKAGDKYELVWKAEDAEKSCAYDNTCEFIKDAATITDLDADYLAETKVQYKVACRSDVSPAYMKLIMHEGESKYSLRGLMWLKASDEDRFTVTESDANLEKTPKKQDEFEQILQSYGRYETEKEFASAPPEFLSFAKHEWMKYVKEVIGK
ncbi:MAG: hypothetical protein IPH18_14505 [Chitinophagaceae bacterium]|nr:hypothetical protein [Chitinophagaceae bacterium]MBK8953008.1 hypothetical protein [Chitinophagaceae bacterium]